MSRVVVGNQHQRKPGVGLNRGEPDVTSFSTGLSDQLALNVFYRFPLQDRIAVTADTQLIQDPALNPAESTIWMFNLRARFTF